MTNNEIKLDQKATNYLKDKLGGGEGGTTVVANPELAGTEADLTGLQVGETKYKVPQGGSAQHYHKVVLLIDESAEYCYSSAISLDVYIDTPESLTVKDVWNYIVSKGPVFIQADTFAFGTMYFDTCSPATDPLFDSGSIEVKGFTRDYDEATLLSTEVTIAYDQYI